MGAAGAHKAGARQLTPPLKGNNSSDSGGGRSGPIARVKRDSKDDDGSSRRASQPQSLAGVRWRVCPVRKVAKDRRLVLLRGYARAQGRLQRVELRVMLDTGAQGEFISPSLARRLGATVEYGRFGVAVEAFGRETPLTQRVRRVELALPGQHPDSLLSQDFVTRWDFTISPGSLSDDYDLLLGTRFIRHFRLHLMFNEPCTIRLTAEDGRVTHVQEEQLQEEHIEQEAQGVAPLQPRATPRPLSQSQRRAILREWRGGDKWSAEQVRRAAADRPDLVMSTEELEQLWQSAPVGTVKVYTLLAQGFCDADAGDTVALNRLAHGKESGASTAKAAVATAEDGSLLPPEERERAARLVRQLTEREFAGVFPSELPAGLPPTRGTTPFRIELKPGTQPFGRYGPRMTAADTQEAEKMLKELLAKGFIRPSRSPWGSPMFLVEKPDGGKRMVIDYRALNAATQRNRYPLPRVDELFDQLQGARYFSKIDLRTGYWQIRVAAEDVPKTAFTSRHGHFEWLVLPMGLTNAPAEFMALMENTFREELNRSVLVFLDDILIYSRTLEEHERHLRAVLQRLQSQKLYAKLSKCQFMRQEVEFLGHYVGRAGVRMVEGKVAAVQRWPTPQCQKEVEQFLGLAGYYRRFIAGFSKLASPLSQLCGTLQKAKDGSRRSPPRKPFVWGKEQQDAFESLKSAVSSAPCLAIPDPQREFIVHTDASGYATGAVLMQQFDGGLRPIAFLSKKMTPAQRNYPVHEQELLAILNALKAWRHYLGGRPFTVLTDHQSLQYVETSAMATPRQVRWAAWLAEFDFKVRYAPGRANVAADALSRGGAGGPPAEAECGQEAKSAAGAVMMVGALRRGGTAATRAPSAAAAAKSEPKLLLAAIGELAPLPVRIRDAARDDAAYRGLLRKPRAQLAKAGFAVSSGLLYKTPRAGGSGLAAAGAESDGVLYVPSNAELRTWLLSAAHDSLLGAHRGAAKTVAWLSERVWWPSLESDVQSYVRGCEACQRNKPDTRGKQGLPLSIAAPKRAWETICMDFIGPLPRTASGHDAVLVVVDKLTRWSYYIALCTTATAQEVFAALQERVLSVHGMPRAIISDRDSRFTSHFWEHLWAAMRTDLRRSTAFHPQTDGQTERQNRTLIEALRAHVDANQRDWDTLLPALQLAHNSSRNHSTGVSPFEMLFGATPRTTLDAELERDGVEPQRQAERQAHPGAQALAERIKATVTAARKRIEAAQQKQRQDSQRGRRECELAVGDKAWLSNRNLRLDAAAAAAGRARKLEPLYYGPYEVLAMHGSNAAELRLPAGCRLHPVFNVDLLKKYIDGRSEFPARPVADARPGPLPAEDPAAGGPGDPVYEVEAVIGKRGRGARLQYRVKWAGWPVEQASWLPASECDSCAEAVADFERQQLERQQRVSAIQQRQQRKAEARVQQWEQKAQTRAHEEEIREQQQPSKLPCASLSLARPLSSPAAQYAEILKSGLQKSAGRGAESLQRKVAPLLSSLSSSFSSMSMLREQRHQQGSAATRVSSPHGRPSLSPSRSA